MRAVQMTGVRRPLELRERELREPGAGEVRVRVRAAGICHSDAHYRAGLSHMGPLPLTLGHEIAGVVERVGAGVTALHEGDRVCLHYLVTCGECVHCLAGRESFCVRGAMLGHPWTVASPRPSRSRPGTRCACPRASRSNTAPS